MLQSGEKYENYYGPERTCLCSRYHAIYGRDTTDQNEHVFAIYIIQFTVVIPRTRTSLLQNTEKHEFSGRMLTPPQTPPQKHQKHHHNLAKQRQVRVLGPDVDTAKKKYEFSGHNTTTKTPPHQHKNTTTPLQEHHHKNITTKNTTTKTSPHNHKNTSMCEQHVCARCLDTLYVNTLCDHEDRKVRKLPRKMNISSWAGCGRTPKSTRITMQTRLQFLGRMLQPQKRQKSPSFIVKAPVKSIGEHRKVRELPRKMNIEEVEEA